MVQARCRPGNPNTHTCDDLAKIRRENGKGPGSEEGSENQVQVCDPVFQAARVGVLLLVQAIT